MAEKFSRYDSADYLETEEDIAAYLEACQEEGGDDPAFLLHAVSVVARARNKSQMARDAGMSREGLYKALSGEGNPSFANVVMLAKATGLRLRLETDPNAFRSVAKPATPPKPAAGAKPVKGAKRVRPAHPPKDRESADSEAIAG